MDPAVSLRVLKAAPTLKSAFSQCNTEEQSSQNLEPKKKKATNNCTAHFGCSNAAVYQEASGTLFCKLHKQVAVTPVLVKKQSKKSAKK